MVYEARVIDRFYKYFAKKNSIRIPKVYWNPTTQRVLTMEFIPGKHLTTVLKRPGNYTSLARQLADATFDQMFNLGLFHADPHPGNIIVTPDNKLA